MLSSLRKIQTVLVDIDDTLTQELPEAAAAKNGQTILADYLQLRDRIPQNETLRELSRIFDPERECLTSILPLFHVSPREFWDQTADQFHRCYRVYPDAVYLLKTLHRLPIKVYTATTNSPFITRLKLSAAMDGTDWEKCIYLDGYYPGNAFHDARGKHAPDFIRKIMQDGGFSPDTTMMIGDDLRYDLQAARYADIRHCVIINRELPEACLQKDGALFVNSLKIIADALSRDLLS